MRGQSRGARVRARSVRARGGPEARELDRLDVPVPEHEPPAREARHLEPRLRDSERVGRDSARDDERAVRGEPVRDLSRIRRARGEHAPGVGVVRDDRERAARDVQPVMVNGRISPRSFKRWRRFSAAAKHLLGKYALLTAQDEMSATRLQQLGLKNVFTPGNLKLDAPPLSADASHLAELQEATTGRPIWLAASTHPGEEEQILDAHHMIAETVDNLMTVIVPRHPERGDAIADMLRRGGVSPAQRSKGDTPQAHNEIYLMDTLDEMGLAYRLAEIAFIGGTLVPHGGQNPFEAAQLDCAILHGPHIINFEILFDDLAAKGAAAEVTDAATLATQVNALFNNQQCDTTGKGIITSILYLRISNRSVTRISTVRCIGSPGCSKQGKIRYLLPDE